MNKFSSTKEFLQFLRKGKKWSIAPIDIFLLTLSALLVSAEDSARAPFIYCLL